MKSTKTSFLFFCLIISSLAFFCTNLLSAQQEIDSTYYYYDLANNPKNASDLISAYTFYKKLKDENSTRKDTIKIIQNLRQISIIQYELGFLHESESTIIEALNLLENVNVVDSLTIEPRVGIYNHLGRIKNDLQEYENAIEFYSRVLLIETDIQRINALLNNIGYAYYGDKKYNLAIDYFDQVYKNYLKSGKKKNIARSLSNLGMSQSKLNSPEALQNLKRALEIRKEIAYDIGILSSFLNLEEYYRDRNDIDKAKNYANKALEIANSSKNVKLKENALSVILDYSEDPNVIQFKKLNDSIKKNGLLVQNKYASKKYAYEKQKQIANEARLKLKDSKLENERQKSINLIYLFLGLLVLLGSVFLYFILKSRHKKDKLQQVFNTESHISKKVHDEVANDVFQIMTKLQSDKPNDALIDDIEQIYNKTRDISKEHSVIDLEGNFEDILNDLILSFNDVNINAIAKGISKINWETVSELKRITIYKVLQELLINMKKHSEASIVVLTFDSNRKTIRINYSDNGKGCDLKKGTGLQNVENRIASINGTITFDSEISKGFKVKLTV